MRDAHLTPDDLAYLLEQELDKSEARLLLHHLAVCPECFAVGGYVLELFEAGAIGMPLCGIEVGLVQSRAQAPRLWQELSGLPLQEQRDRVQEDERFHSWGLCEFLCDQSLAVAPQDAKGAVGLAQLAVDISAILEELSSLGLLRDGCTRSAALKFGVFGQILACQGPAGAVRFAATPLTGQDLAKGSWVFRAAGRLGVPD